MIPLHKAQRQATLIYGGNSQDHGFFWTGGNLLYVGQCPQSPLIQFTISVQPPLPLLCKTFNGQYGQKWGFLDKLFLWRL